MKEQLVNAIADMNEDEAMQPGPGDARRRRGSPDDSRRRQRGDDHRRQPLR